jgi:hypothetical protein
MKSLLSLGKECRFPDHDLYKSFSEAIQLTKCPKSEHLSQTDLLARSGRLILYLAVPQPDDNHHRVDHNDFESSVHDIDRITKKIVKGAYGSQKGEEIEQWVIANCRTSREFALDETTAFWWMIEMGIQIFRNAA